MSAFSANSLVANSLRKDACCLDYTTGTTFIPRLTETSIFVNIGLLSLILANFPPYRVSLSGLLEDKIPSNARVKSEAV
jgi:hypothetical protein